MDERQLIIDVARYRLQGIKRLEMSFGEIAMSYRTAKSPKEQIRVLAELNSCSVQVIEDILIVKGEITPEIEGEKKEDIKKGKEQKKIDALSPTAIQDAPKPHGPSIKETIGQRAHKDFEARKKRIAELAEKNGREIPRWAREQTDTTSNFISSDMFIPNKKKEVASKKTGVKTKAQEIKEIAKEYAAANVDNTENTGKEPSMGTKLSDANKHKEEALKLFRKGMALQDIADKIGMSINSVRRYTLEERVASGKATGRPGRKGKAKDIVETHNSSAPKIVKAVEKKVADKEEITVPKRRGKTELKGSAKSCPDSLIAFARGRIKELSPQVKELRDTAEKLRKEYEDALKKADVVQKEYDELVGWLDAEGN